MELIKSEYKNDMIYYLFAKYGHDDFITNSIQIKVEEDTGVVRTVEFNNHKTGICSFKAGLGLYTCNSWESEDYLETMGQLTKHFQTFFQNGFEGSEFAEKIVNNVMEILEDSYLVNMLNQFLLDPHTEIKFAADKYIAV